MENFISLYDCEDITDQILKLADRIKNNPKIKVTFNVDYTECYYESDTPTHELLIEERK